MFELFIILKDIILPVFILMGIGFILHKKFTLNLSTLAKVNIYLFVPGFIFVKLYQTQISWQLFGNIALFFIAFIAILFVIATIIAKFSKIEGGKKTAFTNSVMFYNSGNYGVPVNDLVFKSDPFAMSVQVLILTMQNIFLFSYGIFSLQSIRKGKLKALLGYFKMPVMYAMIAGIVFNALNVTVPSFLFVPATYIADGLVAMALITLGAQVAELKFKSGLLTVYLSLTLRLIVGPIVAIGIIYLFRIEGTFAQALLISSAMPTSVNSAVIAQEYNNHPHFAAQVVMFSTLVSALTVTVVIYVARILF
ncbi:AEC family transporter [Aquibacillus salsiterrae]|uniref:AEC family transporter n=1 Tax=Aquibacillus salsiterrae TaxID=2950439 RepID=A0A9X3WCR9_9BACI|nr:AEC family transporter [Aquibacillus salsiterrae]MDC3417147.1 AEC family transporter [Aquibacillus salsiterrae]